MSINQTADQESVRKVNSSIVLNALRLHAPISRAELASFTKLNPSTVTNIVNTLIDDGLVLELETMESKIGRPGIALTLRPEGGAIIGVEIGVGFISIILTDFVANILWRKYIDVPPSLPQIEIISKAIKQSRSPTRRDWVYWELAWACPAWLTFKKVYFFSLPTWDGATCLYG
jgi:hypothetical protein